MAVEIILEKVEMINKRISPIQNWKKITLGEYPKSYCDMYKGR